ncbi:phospholipid scramblase-related protein [Aeromicrobium phoceense]|uniref:phospholipid scramblase-related protein n=1 Tax=Aeromicrobium phoceense TaxID=2754045 RepID=UPI0030B82301
MVARGIQGLDDSDAGSGPAAAVLEQSTGSPNLPVDADAAAMSPSTTQTGQPSETIKRRSDESDAAESRAGSGTLLTARVLVVNQKAKIIGSRLEYPIFDHEGNRLGAVQEERRSFSQTVDDKWRGRTEFNRAHRFQLIDRQGRVLLALTRPQMGWFAGKAKLVVEGPKGPFGHIVHESYGVKGAFATVVHTGVTNASTLLAGWGGMAGVVTGAALEGVQGRLNSSVEGLDEVGHARFGLESAAGHRLATINAETHKAWDFNVQDPSGMEIARISKTWAGWAKERFTKADNYVIQIHDTMDEPLVSLIIAAAVAIDVELKQQGDQTRRSAVRRSRTYK